MNPTAEQMSAWGKEAAARANHDWLRDGGSWNNIRDTHFATLACAWQAEADAKLCETRQYSNFRTPENCADAIRANAPKVTT